MLSFGLIGSWGRVNAARRKAVGGRTVTVGLRRRCSQIALGLFVVAMLGAGLGATALGAPTETGAVLPPAASRTVDFAKDIQPILADRCYSCHGPEKQKGDLRWDDRASVLKGGENGPVLVAGQSAASRVIRLVAGLEPDSIMPPRGDRLDAAQIGLLRAWIDQGANWPAALAGAGESKREHWAFRAPVRPALPPLKRRDWSRNPIDRFILARLDKEHLKPSPEAGRTAQIRRLSLDLTGLPPTLGEVDDFLKDRAPDAYEKLVDRLLNSPHYGERWGRHWLDVARYADTNGYEKDQPRSIWPYRDWVIQALNRDLPYDQFLTEQLAGDLLPDSTPDQCVATGFLRNSMLNQEGGIEPEQFRVEALIDRIDTLGKSCLGLTLNCCQCHNHKYDPFSQKEYYQLFALLNNDDEAFMEVPSPAQARQRAQILEQIHVLEDQAMEKDPKLTSRMTAWETSLRQRTNAWQVLDPKDWFNFATKFEKEPDHSLLAGGDLQRGGVTRAWVETTLTNITGFRLEALTNNNLMYGGPGQRGKGSFLIKEFTVDVSSLDGTGPTNRIHFRRASANAEAPGFGITNAIDGNTDRGGWTPTLTAEHRNENHQAVFECDLPAGAPGGVRLGFTLYQSLNGETNLDCHILGSFRLSATTDTAPLAADPLTPAQRGLLAVPVAERSAEQRRELFGIFRHTDADCQELNRQIDRLWAEWPNPPTTLVLRQRVHARQTHVFKRGDRLRPEEAVSPGVPAVLHAWPADAPRNRLGLARWLVDPRSPTTVRVAVNRIWQSYFGQGLVTTPEDFGTRVEPPSHPELLDWLACELMSPTIPDSHGKSAARTSAAWSLKHIHRLIVTSATYRQASRVSPEMLARDQFDRWLERAPRLRVEGEVVQDVALAISGLLNSHIGGPSVYPPIPESVGDTVYGGFSWPESKDQERYRRGLYTFWKRSLPFPAQATFDVPSGETACPRRARSNTPLQALTTLNEKTFVQAAQALARRVMQEGGRDNRSRINYAFRLCTARLPTAAESGRLLHLLEEEYEHFENDTETAVKVAVTDPAGMPSKINLHQAAAWTMVSRVLLNLDETITRE